VAAWFVNYFGIGKACLLGGGSLQRNARGEQDEESLYAKTFLITPGEVPVRLFNQERAGGKAWRRVVVDGGVLVLRGSIWGGRRSTKGGETASF